MTFQVEKWETGKNREQMQLVVSLGENMDSWLRAQDRSQREAGYLCCFSARAYVFLSVSGYTTVYMHIRMCEDAM